MGDPSRAWSAPDTVEYYRTSRCGVEHLYASEKRFLPDLLEGASTVLDFGCATGGFFNVARYYAPGASYTGLDICPKMIEVASAEFRDADFAVFSGGGLPFPDRSFDAVVSLGVLHMTLDWRELIGELWRVARGRLLFDLRLVDGPGVEDPDVSYQRLAFGGEWDGNSVAPYIIAELREVSRVLLGLEPAYGRLSTYGYEHAVSNMTVSPIREVCMAGFLLDKLGPQGTFEWALPLDCPGELRDRSSV